ncbi:MAG: glycosyltransferase, partial [Clostridia bacterium]|nr:glycosyltransferase [Clostridia bacterium]
MANKSLISIIVPVYKVEPYLDKCVSSIVEQTYTDLEIILVDDGSPDNCPAMCDAWAKKDARIKVIHKENGGLSDARNAGMDAANGEYILFVDSDDWIASETCEIMLARMTSTNSDIVSCDAVRVWDGNMPQRKMMRDNEAHVLDRTEAMRALIQSTCLIMTVWNKLYKAQIIKKIPFEKGKIHEDEIWSWQAIGAASRVATVSEALYYYRQRADGIMGDGYTGFPMIVIRAKQQRHDYIMKEMPALADIDSENLLNTCFYQGVQVINHEKGDRRRE